MCRKWTRPNSCSSGVFVCSIIMELGNKILDFCKQWISKRHGIVEMLGPACQQYIARRAVLALHNKELFLLYSCMWLLRSLSTDECSKRKLRKHWPKYFPCLRTGRVELREHSESKTGAGTIEGNVENSPVSWGICLTAFTSPVRLD